MAQETNHVCFGFTTGEVAPIYGARVDVEKLSTACRSIQNITLQAFGGAERRPGLQFIAQAAVVVAGSSSSSSP